ncbi:MAG: cytochrome c [Candidatus Rokubacteria bacterium]|nr:cytochrome c [Candidatus Rokubacteria bacterium]
MSRRTLVALVVAVAVVALLATVLMTVFQPGSVPAGAGTAERLWVVHCAHCHGVDGKGSWRATLFLIRPGDLSDPASARQSSDQYLFDIIKHGGSPIGRPGMPGFPHLSDPEVHALVRYLRSLPEATPPKR